MALGKKAKALYLKIPERKKIILNFVLVFCRTVVSPSHLQSMFSCRNFSIAFKDETSISDGNS